MRRLALTVLLAGAGAGCHLPARAPVALAPLAAEGEVAVYLDALPRESSRLSFTLTSLGLEREDGSVVPRALALAEVTPGGVERQRLVAHGRVPTGRYAGLVATAGRATVVGRDEQVADLLVAAEPTRLPVRLALEPSQGVVVSLRLRTDQAVSPSFAFTLALDATVPFRPSPDLLGFAACPASASLAVFDRRAHRVVGLWPTGAEPRSVALDPLRGRLYVALAGDDAVQVFEAASGAERGRVALHPGDRPVHLALSSDGTRLVTANEGTDTVSIVDAEALIELDRVAVAREPAFVVLARGGRTAYSLSPRQGSVTVVDVPTRAVARTFTLDGSPGLARLTPGEGQLYVAQQGSPFLSLLDLSTGGVKRLFVGAEVQALLVEPRQNMILVGLRGDRRLSYFEPISLLPVGGIDLPGPAGELVIDDIEGALVVAVPDRRQVAFADLVARRTTALLDLWDAPAAVALPDERR